MPSSRPAVLFGAFDRHNFGDLLFPHVLAHMLAPRKMLFAGLVARDLRAFGGHRIHAIGEILTRASTVDLIHAGGELLTCDAWEAAVMLAPAERVQALIAQENAWKADPLAWSSNHLGIAARAPYLLSKTLLHGWRVVFHAMGGADLDRRDESFREEVIGKLKQADEVSVRDRQTHAHLRAQGIDAQLIPDPAVMVAELFGAHIRARATQAPLQAIANAFPQGYAAIQFDAGFGDDATLDVFARALSWVAREYGLGIVLFRAGAAPWHDDPAIHARLKQRLAARSVLFASLDIWDICALIASSRVYCGSSLHGRIVAMAFARPRINIVHTEENLQPPKQAAFAATWEPREIAATAYGEELADAISAALQADTALLRHTADDLARRYRAAFNASAP
ncbi:polysaccharide pyruvyl transferase [Paraburkholderia eburnea]|uniref:Polysaccharide pyruvyl transferase n=1 Tax=Paraburkholderia eburnea TaxID=1189126 RepID=A0A2S4MKA8_9BURK|nr:polysaccharide pyruvyl transferase family protein [Paraburkholderia eburnea]POR54797.1 polysaccharide pyruvyl transferase [Paraburkholderia eburnea]PRZ24604.1 polysaccharide pyruvyl transferase [Paraburkholderia eburnea]